MYLEFIKKLSSFIAKIKHHSVPPEYFYFYRDTYVCQLNQARFVLRDYFFRRPYKEISFDGEFTCELIYVLPFAYWHYLNGTLSKTISTGATREIYFFSKNHEESLQTRSNEGNYNYETPRIVYSHNYNMKKWAKVPLKEVYKNDVYKYSKPLLIIANRYNTEWDGPPISYFSIEILDDLISSLRDKYTIVYNRPLPKNIVNDNSEICDLNEFVWLKEKYPEVLLLHELFEENKIKAKNFNHFQMCVYANSENFISIHGGTAALASYFGGTNIIFSKKGPEHYFKCFEKLYPKLSGATILHAADEETLKKFVTEKLLIK